jgi:large subunit ribosomal protein L15
MNVGELEELADTLVSDKRAKFEGRKIVLDLSDFGCNKLLGAGTITKAMTVKVSAASESAVKKVEEAGGEVLKPK